MDWESFGTEVGGTIKRSARSVASGKKKNPQRISNDDTNMESQTTINQPTGKHFLAFLHVIGSRKPATPFCVFTSNDVRYDKSAYNRGNEKGLKTFIVIKCPNGDADEVFRQFSATFVDTKTRTGWFCIPKIALSEFAAKVCANGQYSQVSEFKARLK